MSAVKTPIVYYPPVPVTRLAPDLRQQAKRLFEQHKMEENGGDLLLVAKHDWKTLGLSADFTLLIIPTWCGILKRHVRQDRIVYEIASKPLQVNGVIHNGTCNFQALPLITDCASTFSKMAQMMHELVKFMGRDAEILKQGEKKQEDQEEEEQ